MSNESFNYQINLASEWPPKLRPQPPFGPTMMEILRSCALRACFEVSSGYERRMGVAARIGIVLHSTIQAVAENSVEGKTTEQVAERVSEIFYSMLKVQRSIADERPRERGLPWDNNRVERALQAAMAECIRMNESGYVPVISKVAPDSPLRAMDTGTQIQHSPVLSNSNFIALEVPVRSNDGRFKGRVDRAEKSDDGVHLFDYKSAAREDLPERYERQLRLYAYMWHDTFGDWPKEAQVYYPLRGVFFSVDISSTACQEAVAEAVMLISNLTNADAISHLATPGDVCKVCEFRAWCQPFWAVQASEKKYLRAVELAGMGLEGRIESIILANHYWKISISWRDAKIRLVAPQERFPYLSVANPGQTLRVLDVALRGQLYEPSGVISEYTEIFLLKE